jgi:hypothetical protein
MVGLSEREDESRQAVGTEAGIRINNEDISC